MSTMDSQQPSDKGTYGNPEGEAERERNMWTRRALPGWLQEVFDRAERDLASLPLWARPVVTVPAEKKNG